MKEVEKMKKPFFILLAIIVLVIIIISFTYWNYQKMALRAEELNREMESYTTNPILGSSLLTLMNKVIDQNEKNAIDKDEKGFYIENQETSIKIDVKFLESDKLFSMENIQKAGIEQFVKNYGNMVFQCIDKSYHTKTKRISYLRFDQI